MYYEVEMDNIDISGVDIDNRPTYDEIMAEIQKATLEKTHTFSTSSPQPSGVVASCGENAVVICHITFSTVGSWGTKTMIREANGFITTRTKGTDSAVGYSILHRFEGKGAGGVILSGQNFGGGTCKVYRYSK